MVIKLFYIYKNNYYFSIFLSYEFFIFDGIDKYYKV